MAEIDDGRFEFFRPDSLNSCAAEWEDYNVKAMIEATDEVVVKAIDKVVIEASGKATIEDTDEDEADTGIVKYTAQRQTTITTMSILYKNNSITFRLMMFFILTRLMNNLMIICMMNCAILTCLIMQILMMCNLIMCMMIMCMMNSAILTVTM